MRPPGRRGGGGRSPKVRGGGGRGGVSRGGGGSKGDGCAVLVAVGSGLMILSGAAGIALAAVIR